MQEISYKYVLNCINHTNNIINTLFEKINAECVRKCVIS